MHSLCPMWLLLLLILVFPDGMFGLSFSLRILPFPILVGCWAIKHTYINKYINNLSPSPTPLLHRGGKKGKKSKKLDLSNSVGRKWRINSRNLARKRKLNPLISKSRHRHRNQFVYLKCDKCEFCLYRCWGILKMLLKLCRLEGLVTMLIRTNICKIPTTVPGTKHTTSLSSPLEYAK